MNRPTLFASVAALLTLLAATPEGRGEAYVIQFNSLAAEEGSVVDNVTIQAGPFVATIHNSLVIAPTPSVFDGVGLLPQAGGSIDIVDSAGQFQAQVIAAGFEPQTSHVVDWTGDRGDGYPTWNWQETMTYPWEAMFFEAGPPPGDVFAHINLTAGPDNGTQLLYVAITPATFPEPSSLLTLALGVGGVLSGLLRARKAGPTSARQ